MTLKEMRDAAGLSQSQVADLIGKTTQGAVSQWEQGIGYPRTDKIAKLAELYHTTADRIIQAIREVKETV